MSTHPDIITRPHVSRECADWRSRVGDTLSILVGGRVVEAPLRRVSLDCGDVRPAVHLHVETPGGSLQVSPAAVLG